MEENVAVTGRHVAWQLAIADANPAGGSPTLEQVNEARESLNIPKNEGTATWITHRAYHDLYDVSSPPKKPRGSGWTPYADSWIRMFDDAKLRVMV